MTVQEKIEMVQLRGTLCESGIISLLNDKYAEWAMISFEDEYFVTYSVLDSYADICYYEDIESFENELRARTYCLNLPTDLNGEVYE